MRHLEIVEWETFQHYKDRDPLWIKNYLHLLHKDEYLELTGHRRAVLHGLWLVYPAKRRRVRDDTASLSRALNLRVTMADLEALAHAGFIRLSASNVLAPSYQDASLEAEGEKEKSVNGSTSSLDGTAEKIHAIERLLDVLPDKDNDTPAVLSALCRQLPPSSIEKVRESVVTQHPRSPVRYAVGGLRSEIKERA